MPLCKIIQMRRQSLWATAQIACLCPKRGNRRRYWSWKILPFSLTAALAHWLRRRRILQLPFGERWLRDTPALSSSPGHAPLQFARRTAEAAHSRPDQRDCPAEICDGIQVIRFSPLVVVSRAVRASYPRYDASPL